MPRRRQALSEFATVKSSPWNLNAHTGVLALLGFENTMCTNRESSLKPWSFTLSLIASTCLLFVSAFAGPNVELPLDLMEQGWEQITFDDKQPNRFASCGDGCVEVETDSSVSMIGKEFAIDLSKMPMLNWEWRIENRVVESDLSVKGEDDRAVALYVTFPYDPDTASFSENMMRPFVEIVRGTDAPGRMLSYVWGGFGNPGDMIESPFFGAVNAMIICQNSRAPVGEWVYEETNIIADHERAFGSTPTKVAHILLAADSDDTGGKNRASVRKIMFRAK